MTSYSIESGVLAKDLSNLSLHRSPGGGLITPRPYGCWRYMTLGGRGSITSLVSPFYSLELVHRGLPEPLTVNLRGPAVRQDWVRLDQGHPPWQLAFPRGLKAIHIHSKIMSWWQKINGETEKRERIPAWWAKRKTRSSPPLRSAVASVGCHCVIKIPPPHCLVFEPCPRVSATAMKGTAPCH